MEGTALVSCDNAGDARIIVVAGSGNFARPPPFAILFRINANLTLGDSRRAADRDALENQNDFHAGLAVGDDVRMTCRRAEHSVAVHDAANRQGREQIRKGFKCIYHGAPPGFHKIVALHIRCFARLTVLFDYELH